SGEYAGEWWIDDNGTFEQVSHVAGVHRAGAAEGEQRQAAIVDAAIDGMRSGRRSHGFADHAIDAGGCLGDRGAELLRQPGQLLLGADLVELHVAAEEVAGIEIAEHQIRIGNARICAAAAVTDRARRRAGALRADLEQAEIADWRDAAAAGADLDHV